MRRFRLVHLLFFVYTTVVDFGTVYASDG